MKFLLSLLFCCNLIFALSIGNGEIKIIEIKEEFAAKLTINSVRTAWIKHPAKNGYKIAFIVAGYHQNKNFLVRNGDDVEFSELVFKLEKIDYKKEFLSVAPEKINPPYKEQIRIKKERDEANQIYRTFTDGLLFDSKFELPIDTQITSYYGTARMFNNSLKSYHSGTDFRAAVGKEIKAANSGIVRIAKNRYYAGNSVVIDHGSGIYTQYYHLSKINVKVGQKVQKGDIIGLSGSSGRVTGPHLHFGVMVNKIQVNPLDFIEKTNQLFN